MPHLYILNGMKYPSTKREAYRKAIRAATLTAVVCMICQAGFAEVKLNPYDKQVAGQVATLKSGAPHERSAAAEALGYLRAFSASEALARAAGDDAAAVRREAVMSLGWCGGKKAVGVLLDRLDDTDWTVRQAAWVALTNITGAELEFDALAKSDAREERIKAWKAWWTKFQTGQAARPPAKATSEPTGDKESGDPNLALRRPVVTSSLYKGPASALTDGSMVGAFWQTKNIKFPQHCTIDLQKSQMFGCVVVQQYGPGFCMTDYSVSVSSDGKTYKQVHRSKKRSPVRLVAAFKPENARYVRVTSYNSANRTYPTTFREVGVYAKTPPKAPIVSSPASTDDSRSLALERKARSLGALGGPRDAAEIIQIVKPYLATQSCSPAENSMVQVCLRSLGRIGGDEAKKMLIEFIANPRWARYAADALGDIGGEDAQAALIEAYPRYSRSLNLKAPKVLPRDDRPGLDPRDRMYQTPYAIALALSRMRITDPENLKALKAIAPLLLANMPSDYDGALLYQPEAYQPVTAHLLRLAGIDRAAKKAAFASFGNEKKTPETPLDKTLADLAGKYAGDVPYAAIWLPTLCTGQDVPDLIELLTHKNGWVRINAAKAIMFIGDKRGLEPIAKGLKDSKTEGSYGYYGEYFNNKTQGHAEYNDPTPRWREAFVRALGRLGATDQIKMISGIMQDDQNALGVRHAAAIALDELGTDEAVAILKQAEIDHPFYSVRLAAREALWRRGLLAHRDETPLPASGKTSRIEANDKPYPIVFIKGANKMPNRFQIDPWRQTYSTTDSGPTYRIGDNLHILGSDGTVTQLTRFKDGYVADCEVSWDGKRIIFAKRGGKTDPWWHVWEIRADGKGLRQITKGPYHDVQPAYLPDGRIVFSSSRIGIRDEYHGYHATGLTVMNADGGDMHFIGLNLGRDNEPAMMPDGRIVFSRLELFYSRLKTEITVQAINPDGTRNVTLYGPERRDFWRNVTRANKEGWWGEVAPRHRVLRMTQPKSFDDGRIVCATTAGLTIIGPGRYRETVIPRFNNMAVTSPIPLDANTILCAATVRDAAKPQLGLYKADVKTGTLTKLYDDPNTAEFEPRPIRPRPRPRVLSEAMRTNSYTATLFCSSARISQEARTRNRGRLVRIVEGQPIVTRHETHLNGKGPSWKNHVGTHARVLGTVPLAPDGSFSLQVPADRLIHCQVLDSDRRVVGNQLIWMYARPGERKACVGCHELPDATMLPTHRPQALRITPVKCLPTGGEFSYRAKFWNKGTLSDEGEERTRTVRAVSLIGRQ